MNAETGSSANARANIAAIAGTSSSSARRAIRGAEATRSFLASDPIVPPYEEAIPTTGASRVIPPVEPQKRAAPNANTPPSDATSQ